MMSTLFSSPFMNDPSSFMDCSSVDFCSGGSSSTANSGSSSPQHSNPELLDGFALDGGSVEISVMTTPTNRKRKEIPESTEDRSDSGESRPKRSKGKSLLSVTVPVHSGFEELRLHSGTISPVLAMMQQASGSQNGSRTSSPMMMQPSATTATAVSVAVPLSKEERAELKRHRKAMKLLKLEKSIAQLQAQLAMTQEVAVACQNRAEMLATQANTDGFFATNALTPTAPTTQSNSPSIDASLPPLSPLDLSSSVSTATSTADASDRLVRLNAARVVVSTLDSSFDCAPSIVDAMSFVEHVLPKGEASPSQLLALQSCLSDGSSSSAAAEEEDEMMLEKEWNRGVEEFTQAVLKSSQAHARVQQQQVVAWC